MHDLSILLVEDEETIREELGFFLRYLAPEGVYVASDGEAGLELYRKHRPDIVITDLEMPQQNGMEMIEEIRRIDPGQPVIVTTAHSDSRFLLRAIELRIDHYLLKPIDLSILEEKIAKIGRQLRLEREFRQQRQILEEIAHLERSMLIVLDNAFAPIFLNREYLEFFRADSLEEYRERGCRLSDCMQHQEETFVPESREGFDWVRELEKREPGRRVIALKNPHNRKVAFYTVSITKIAESGHVIVALSEITELATRQQFYRRRARFDELTGLYNRFVFNEEFAERIKRAQGLGKSLCLILFDLDHFKAINDRHGHSVGDRILVEVAQLLRGLVEPGDFLGRWGGEEFVILTFRDPKETQALAEKVRRELKKHLFAEEITLRCSCGIACSREGKETAEKLFRRADAALYRAKNEGRDRVVADC